MPMVAVFAFIDLEGGGVMVVLSDEGGDFGGFAGGVGDFMVFANPTARRLIGGGAKASTHIFLL